MPKLRKYLSEPWKMLFRADDDDDVMMESSSSAAMMNEASSSAMTQSSKPAAAAHTYTNGTFAATGNYRSPAGSEAVNVTITLKDDVITDATFVGTATAPKSVTMQGKFAAGFKEAVVGKSIDSLSLNIVNGSSLTPMGFMDAVAKIKAEAKA
jgi:hypothetical protein